eukprot:gnl/TRDRNA2_/TRDRNA2_155797_c0_seq1.p1 gnl/TRDRNA2_/TRDRNA2_155797_c0~~gnl/TRDRNA2_/TRDRNA2_155797_c0_seq1.p1  ORF type:complete len:435 (-),score=131.38 gnl/TRDRNA2_/TRDRNA2_155797_c0_seq1:69-1277(-)
MAQEHQEYIQTKVNPTLEGLVTQVLLERPDNPVPFMIRWLSEQTKAPQAAATTTSDSGEAEKLRSEISALQAEIKELESKVGKKGSKEKSKESKEDESEEEEEDDDDDAPDLPPPPAAYMNRGPRQSVSAEAYGAWNKVKDFTPPVHPKTEEQKDRLSKVLQRCILFSSMDKEEMTILINAMIEKPVEADTRLIKEGDDGEVMYVIEEGKFECFKKIDGVEKVVKTCLEGDFFGELALLYNCPRAASVEARNKSLLWQLDRETFNAIVRDSSIKKREMYEKFLKSVPILEQVGQYEKKSLADALKKEKFDANTIVIKQGQQGDRFYMVEEGELFATKNGKNVMTYKRGDYFGELALLTDEARAATVMTKTDCKLMSIDRPTFKNLLGGIQGILKKKAAKYAA